MVRSEFCALTDTSAPTFNTHRRNGDLPFKLEEVEAKDGKGKVWSRFTLIQAALMLAARKLSASQGVTWSEAAKILREQNTLVGGLASGGHFWDHPAIHVARAEFVNEDTGADPAFRARFEYYQGPLDEIAAAAVGEADAYTMHRGDVDCLAVASLVSVDVSHCWRVVCARAVELGIKTDSDGNPEADET